MPINKWQWAIVVLGYASLDQADLKLDNCHLTLHYVGLAHQSCDNCQIIL